MNQEDKNLLKQELIKFNQRNYSGKSVKSASVELITWVASEFEDKRHAVRLLVENEYGLLGNLLFKYMRDPDDEITDFITDLDTRLVKSAYHRFGNSFITDGNGGSPFCLKILLREKPELISLVNGYFNSEEFAYEVASYCPRVMEKMNPNLKRNRIFVKKMTDINPDCFEYVDWRFKADDEIARDCVMRDPEMIRCADITLRQDKQLMMHIVRHRGLLLSYADDRLKDDFDVVHAAVGDTGLALRYASDRLQKNDELIQMAEENRRKIGWQR